MGLDVAALGLLRLMRPTTDQPAIMTIQVCKVTYVDVLSPLPPAPALDNLVTLQATAWLQTDMQSVKFQSPTSPTAEYHMRLTSKFADNDELTIFNKRPSGLKRSTPEHQHQCALLQPDTSLVCRSGNHLGAFAAQRVQRQAEDSTWPPALADFGPGCDSCQLQKISKALLRQTLQLKRCLYIIVMTDVNPVKQDR